MQPERRKILLAALVAVAALLAAAPGCGGRSAAAPDSGAPLPLVVDTDMSTDDVLALLYLARRPTVDLLAVTVSGTGLAHCSSGARHALELLAVAGRSDVPVACGRPDPLAGDNQFPPEWRERADAFFGLELPPAAGRVDPTAVGLLRSVIEAAGGKVTLLSLAPLTTTAALLRRDPSIRSRLAAIYAMGGAVRVPGNVGAGHERVEYNLWVDPVAAREVLAAGVPVTLVPLDATNDVPVTVYFWSALRRYHYATPAATAAWDLLGATGMFAGGQYFWDPLAAAAVADPGALSYEQLRLRVVTAPGAENGRTAVDGGGAPVRVAVGASRPTFEHVFLRGLLHGAPFAIPPARAGASIVYDGRRAAYRGPSRGPAGQVAFDTVNRSARPFRHLVGNLSEGKTAIDLRAYVRRFRDGAFRPPVWFSTETAGETPPHSRMTWLATLAAGEKAIVAVDAQTGAASVVAQVTVAAAG